MRILVAITPRLYREVLALSIHRHRPDFEVLLAPPWSLDGEPDILRPHVLVHDADGADLPPGLTEGASCLLRIRITDRVEASIVLDGTASEFHDDVSLDEVFAALDEAERLSLGDAREGPTTVPLRAHRGLRLRPGG